MDYLQQALAVLNNDSDFPWYSVENEKLSAVTVLGVLDCAKTLREIKEMMESGEDD